MMIVNKILYVLILIRICVSVIFYVSALSSPACTTPSASPSEVKSKKVKGKSGGMGKQPSESKKKN